MKTGDLVVQHAYSTKLSRVIVKRIGVVCEVMTRRPWGGEYAKVLWRNGIESDLNVKNLEVIQGSHEAR